jgi:hypothetical protein
VTIRAHLLATLQADEDLTDILTGGIYDASSLPQDGLTPSAVPSAFSGARLLPCALIRFRNVSETAILGASKRRFFDLYFYQASGQDQIDAAMARFLVLLHRRKQFKTDDDQVYYTTWVENVGDLTADEFEGAAMSYSRYYLDYLGG